MDKIWRYAIAPFNILLSTHNSKDVQEVFDQINIFIWLCAEVICLSFD